MFNAIFLTKLPMSLREHIDKYLGNRPEILLKEAITFHLLINQLYQIVFDITKDSYFYVLLPTREFKDHLVDLHDLRLDFVNCLRPMEVYVCGFNSVRNTDTGDRDYSKFLSQHDWLFSRAVFKTVVIWNSLLQLYYQGVRTILEDDDYSRVFNRIGRLRMANCQYVLDQLLPWELPWEVPIG